MDDERLKQGERVFGAEIFKNVPRGTITDIKATCDQKLSEISSIDVLDNRSIKDIYDIPWRTSRPEIDTKQFIYDDTSNGVLQSSEIAIKYQGYIEREKRIADKILKLENLSIPDNFDYSRITALSIESRIKLERYRPKTIAQASRISGVLFGCVEDRN